MKNVRKNLFETNSSSSHSVVISMDPSGILDRDDWKLNIDDKGILHIPSFNDFGREFFCTNSVLRKLQYLSCNYIYGPYINKVKFGKLVHKFSNTIKGFLGINGVLFDEVVEYYKSVNSGENNDEFYSPEFPCVDHNSRDLFQEITESEETIKNFLLNKNSWLYGGSDEYELNTNTKFYRDTEILSKPIACLSAELGGEIGRVDIEITSDLRQVNTKLDFFKYFSCVDGKWIVNENLDYFSYYGLILDKDQGICVIGKLPRTILIPININFYDYGCFSI